MRRSVLTLAVVLSSVIAQAWRPASGATITVNSLSDPGSAGICTLRDAIQAANTDTAVNGCVAGSVDDTIDLTGVTGTITLVSGELVTSTNVTINGPGASLLAIDGNHASRVFHVTGGTLTLADLTIQNGSALSENGGGIFIDSSATATLTNCTLSGNSSDRAAGGVLVDYGATATLTNCTLSGNSAPAAGGIATIEYSTTTLTDCTLSGNSATTGDSGGMANVGTTTLTNCTLSGNSSATFAGGFGSSGTATLINCTLSNNSAGFAGGGILNNGGTMTLADTIVANSPSGGDCVNHFGTVTDSGHNLIQDTVHSCGLTNGTNGDIVGQDPLLGPLGNYGGPTQTLALLAGSPAIDAGDPVVCADPPVNGVDQRGYARPGTGSTACSIGAFEYYAPNLPPDCSAAAASPSTLWPPNHQLVNIAVTGVTDPDGDPVSITITGIRQDEPLTGLGSGDMCPDGTGIGTSTATLRAERTGTGDGRVYHVYFNADDGIGGTCSGAVVVCAPHDQGKGTVCVDQGPLVDSTAPCK